MKIYFDILCMNDLFKIYFDSYKYVVVTLWRDILIATNM